MLARCRAASHGWCVQDMRGQWGFTEIADRGPAPLAGPRGGGWHIDRGSPAPRVIAGVLRRSYYQEQQVVSAGSC